MANLHDPITRKALSELEAVVSYCLNFPKEWAELEEVVLEMHADKERPLIQRGDVYAQLTIRKRHVADLEHRKPFVRNNNRWAAISRVLIYRNPQIKDKLRPRASIVDEILRELVCTGKIGGVSPEQASKLQNALKLQQHEQTRLLF